MVFSAKEAARRARASTRNVPGTCQLWTRTQLGAGSAGDQDGDGDADAVDGWKSEPVSARVTDRKPPEGAPVAWSGGRNGFGHRAISLGPNDKGAYMIRSTDAGGSGVVATVDLAWVERNWGLHYLGWSRTITGIPIPGLEKKEPFDSRGPKVDEAIKDLAAAERRTPEREARDAKLDRALKILRKIPFIGYKK